MAINRFVLFIFIWLANNAALGQENRIWAELAYPIGGPSLTADQPKNVSLNDNLQSPQLAVGTVTHQYFAVEQLSADQQLSKPATKPALPKAASLLSLFIPFAAATEVTGAGHFLQSIHEAPLDLAENLERHIDQHGDKFNPLIKQMAIDKGYTLGFLSCTSLKAITHGGGTIGTLAKKLGHGTWDKVTSINRKFPRHLENLKSADNPLKTLAALYLLAQDNNPLPKSLGPLPLPGTGVLIGGDRRLEDWANFLLNPEEQKLIWQKRARLRKQKIQAVQSLAAAPAVQRIMASPDKLSAAQMETVLAVSRFSVDLALLLEKEVSGFNALSGVEKAKLACQITGVLLAEGLITVATVRAGRLIGVQAARAGQFLSKSQKVQKLLARYPALRKTLVDSKLILPGGGLGKVGEVGLTSNATTLGIHTVVGNPTVPVDMAVNALEMRLAATGQATGLIATVARWARGTQTGLLWGKRAIRYGTAVVVETNPSSVDPAERAESFEEFIANFPDDGEVRIVKNNGTVVVGTIEDTARIEPTEIKRVEFLEDGDGVPYVLQYE